MTLAKNLGLSITAEGVEHKDQLEFLNQEGCDEIQGYYYAKPMPLNIREAILVLNMPSRKKGDVHYL